jgi:hypothetical protein
MTKLSAMVARTRATMDVEWVRAFVKRGEMISFDEMAQTQNDHRGRERPNGQRQQRP